VHLTEPREAVDDIELRADQVAEVLDDRRQSRSGSSRYDGHGRTAPAQRLSPTPLRATNARPPPTYEGRACSQRVLVIGSSRPKDMSPHLIAHIRHHTQTKEQLSQDKIPAYLCSFEKS